MSKLKFAWFSATDLKGRGFTNTPIFELEFTALHDINNLNEVLWLNENILELEAVTAKSKREDIKLQFGQKEVLSLFNLYQNRPNPFSGLTDIVFDLPEDEVVTISVINPLGQIVYTYTAQYSKGRNKLVFTAQNLPAGIYRYILTTDNQQIGKSMMIIGTAH